MSSVLLHHPSMLPNKDYDHVVDDDDDDDDAVVAVAVAVVVVVDSFATLVDVSNVADRFRRFLRRQRHHRC